MHRILDNRMGGISSRNFRMFRNLCGDKSLSNVAIVTNFWEGVDIQVGEAREKELSLKDAFFKPILDKGARLVRHNPSTLKSAQTILRSFLGQTPQPLQIQCELGTGMDITETLAGKELNRELTELIAEHRKEMFTLVNEMNEAGRMRDEETRKELAEDRAKLQTEIKKIQSDASNLAASYAEALAKLQQQMEEKDNAINDPRDIIGESDSQAHSGNGFKNLKDPVHDNAVLEARLGGAFPVFGFGGKLAVMLSPFSLSWK
ncbi:hypothetical protein C0993_001901 [Termitomyces sp. T159_Od127]|nr:hypothetical protein C0993_001901 [Termitomyces sp. T159_Od127]